MRVKEQMMDRNIPGLVQASSHEELTRLQCDAILAHGRKLGRCLSILEAGCGQRWALDLSGLDYTLTGVDLDADALELRKTKVRDLDIAICGDLCSLELSEASFDVIHSCFVLEHVPRADVALQNFVKWLKPGGILILVLPDRDTALGFLSRVLPHRLHVWYSRYGLGVKTAGLPGHPPYPTSYHPVIGSRRLYGFLVEHGMKLLGCYGNGFSYQSGSTIDAVVTGVAKTISILSWGRLNADYSSILYLASKSAESSTS